MPEHTYYELKLAALTEDGAKIINAITRFLPPRHDTRARANAKRRAIAELFGDAVQVDIISVRRVPAKVIRRRLKA